VRRRPFARSSGGGGGGGEPRVEICGGNGGTRLRERRVAVQCAGTNVERRVDAMRAVLFLRPRWNGRTPSIACTPGRQRLLYRLPALRSLAVLSLAVARVGIIRRLSLVRLL